MLQALHLPEQGPATALVDGRILRPGDRLGDRVVVTIDRLGLVLRSGAVTERVPLLTGPAKQAVGSVVEMRSAQIMPTAPNGSAAMPLSAAVQTAPVAPTGALTLAGRATP